ncbi:CRISPR-associated endoribonuclease Cas6 [Tissierella pigra]|uniref:CRISPR-associated endoribonuclease Cas6 n=1 Tax=Tissierella pigra TaxID=2607614 RepID=UPI001C0FDD89|nr:CRISPR-associated endoribonuclease Cas6 [Tissierella pigra]MBU5425323.1 CRISPR-associated endoribonuclease Cas6 [Tissierella pigra]
MHIKISFTSEKNIILPIQYNSIIQAFVYNNIDEGLSEFLHNSGYINNGRSFKLFAFSRIINRAKKEGERFNFGRKMNLVVSSPLDNFCKSIANHMLQKDDLYIGQNNIKTDQIQIFNHIVEKDEILIDTLSPIVAYSTLLKPDGGKYTCYFMPRETDFDRIITENLIKKYNALNNTNLAFANNIELTPIGQAKQNIVYYKSTVIKGATGKFLIKGDRKLLQMGLDAGFGSKNSQGFGCVKLL